jgi:hypothetical protein
VLDSSAKSSRSQAQRRSHGDVLVVAGSGRGAASSSDGGDSSSAGVTTTGAAHTVDDTVGGDALKFVFESGNVHAAVEERYAYK